jgi:hypothetical protein
MDHQIIDFPTQLSPVKDLSGMNFGAERFRKQPFPELVQVKAFRSDGKISATEILTSIEVVHEGNRFLFKGGPHLWAYFWPGNSSTSFSWL